MARRNRVAPTGELLAVAARGGWMGNRGVLHDAGGRIVRRWTTRAWITCHLEFRGRRRALMQPGRYTELFFLDEATAYAAGHRPCGECRHGEFVAFARLWAAVHQGRPDGPRARAGEIDRRLHAERQGAASPPAAAGDLPDGVMVRLPGDEGTVWLLLGGRLHRWTPAGYGPGERVGRQRELHPITPPSVMGLLAAGLPCQVHPSASGS